MATSKLTDEQWENLCTGCGQCCLMGTTRVRCPSLGVFNQCTVYPERTEKELCTRITPDNVERLEAAGIVPNDCPLYRHQVGLLPLPGRPVPATGVPFKDAGERVITWYNTQKEWWFEKGGREQYEGDMIEELKDEDVR